MAGNWFSRHSGRHDLLRLFVGKSNPPSLILSMVWNIRILNRVGYTTLKVAPSFDHVNPTSFRTIHETSILMKFSQHCLSSYHQYLISSHPCTSFLHLHPRACLFSYSVPDQLHTIIYLFTLPNNDLNSNNKRCTMFVPLKHSQYSVGAFAFTLE